MTPRLFCVLFFAWSLLASGPPSHAATILFMVSDAASPINADPAIVEFLTAQGHTVNLLTSANASGDQQREAAAGADLVIISESIGSTSVVTDGLFNLVDSPTPVISFEAFMFDDARWTGLTSGEDFGNTGRIEADVVGLGAAQDAIFIQDPGHPAAAGQSGRVVVYASPYSVNYGVVGPGADIVASADPDGNFPTTFVYDDGDELIDGRITPGVRIGVFLGQAANPNANTPLDWGNLTAEGMALFKAAVDYALAPAPPAAAPVASPWALAGLACLLLFAGARLVRTRRTASA
jgi:hypothetical protein